MSLNTAKKVKTVDASKGTYLYFFTVYITVHIIKYYLFIDNQYTDKNLESHNEATITAKEVATDNVPKSKYYSYISSIL